MDSTPPPELRRPWQHSDRRLPRTVVQPALRFMATEAAGGIVMLAAAIVALLWANSPWHEGYDALWDTQVAIRVGDLVDLSGMTLHDWVNDGLMAIFFLIAGLEIKRQLVTGELHEPKAAALPALAALGGVVVPALVFTLFNAGHAGARGWGIPVATDIAFAVGIVAAGRPPHPARRPHLHPHAGRGGRHRRHHRDRRLLRATT